MRTTTTVRQIIDQVDTPESLWDRAELIHYARKFLLGYHNYYVVRRNRAAKQYAAEQELVAKKVRSPYLTRSVLNRPVH